MCADTLQKCCDKNDIWDLGKENTAGKRQQCKLILKTELLFSVTMISVSDISDKTDKSDIPYVDYTD